MFESSLDSENFFNWEEPLFPGESNFNRTQITQLLFSALGMETITEMFSPEAELNNLALLTSADTPQQTQSDFNTLPTLTTDALTGIILDPGNSLATALDLGILTGTQTHTEFVNVTDLSDYYQIYIENPSSLNIVLEGIGGDADIKLIQDINQNGLVEYNEVIDGSYNNTRSEQINIRNINPGFYYIHVTHWSGDINYTLSLTASTPIPIPPDFAGNTTPTAYDLGTGITPQLITEYVGDEDFSDYYRFTLDTPSSLNAFLDGVTGTASLSLGQDLDGNGWISYSEEIDWSYGSLTQPANVSASYLQPGTYYLQVYTFDDQVNYNLNLSTTIVAPLSPDLAGNTLSTAYPIGGLETPQVFTDAVNSGDTIDFYRFDLAADSILNLSLDQFTADADVAVIRDINGDGIANYTEILQTSTNPSIIPENLSANLIPGTYYIAVFQHQGDTQYHLNLSTTPTPPLGSNPGGNLPGFDANIGYGLIDANVAVAAAQGQPTAFVDVPDITSSAIWNNTTDLNQINVPEVWNQGITGEGVVVAVIDSGVDVNHPDLINNIWRNSDEIANNGIDDDLNGYVDDIQGYDFENNDNDPRDLDSHGTHVAGTIAAQRDGIDQTSTGTYEVSGVAYNAEIMPLRVFSDVGDYKTPEQQDTAVANGIRYAVDNGASVINMSLGLPFWTSAWLEFPQTNAALSYAKQNNVVAVIAAGNERDLGGTYPSEPALRATENLAIAVGAVDSSNQFAYFANPAGSFSGAYPYVVAPGIGVISTTPNHSYAGFNGTSMAAPYVTGVVALMQQANPNLTVTDISTLLSQSANITGIVV